ncbi:effector-associated domain EAD1-containing protein [[Kitasatospora] papulosa]|uniref:effector-associated domain EAD1-containing protein n=1 Tax=[Kitasatospora] papulosa TaxID=1464011 RepID=UPI0036AC1D9A
MVSPAEEALRPHEVRELASIYVDARQAEQLLRSAGYPPHALPFAQGAQSGDYWEQISLSLATGIMAGGRLAILAKASERYPANRVFAAETAAPSPAPPSWEGSRPPLKLMIMGSEPVRRGSVRAAAELREIQSAVGDQMDVLSCPAATAQDLSRIRRYRPDILHLACHGSPHALLLEDQDGEPHELPPDELIETLRLAADHYGHQLRLLMLRSCDSAEIAERFTSVADVVIAHRGTLDSDCSTLFAAHYYRELGSFTEPLESRHFKVAAQVAAQDVTNHVGLCRSLRTGLIVLPA